MIIFGKYDRELESIIDSENGKIYNFTSTREGYPIMGIAPPSELYSLPEKDFDQTYALHLINNDELFVKMFKPVLDAYHKTEVYILVSDYADDVNESLIKFYQARYGLIIPRVNEEEDYDSLDREKFTFTVAGLYNFDEDLKRFIKLRPDIAAEYKFFDDAYLTIMKDFKKEI